MTDWEPATEVEAALRDALRANDQELYFRILAGADLFLPVSAQALAGEAPMGWGTWTTGGRTHVLAFTSPPAMRACLGADAGPSRRSPYADLAGAWPHHEWWLAVNPGLPVEGYLPAWFVSQLSRGDVRLPGRTMGARARLERVESLAAEQPGTASADGWGQPQPAIGGVFDAPPTRPAAGREPHLARAAHGPGPAPAGTPGGQPTVPAPATRPEAVPADAGPPVNGEPGPRPDPRDDGAGRTGVSWPIPPRRRLLAEGLGARSAGDESLPNGHSSFFEPASGRGATARAFRDNPLRSGERATPPLRPGLGGQPFPRRQPASPPGADPTRAFRMDTDQAKVTPPVPGPGTNGLRPDRPTQEPTRAFRVPGPEATQALPLRRPTPAPTPAEESTQPLLYPSPRPVPAPAPVEVPPVSYAEQVFAQSASRRGFSPIVIEGTVIASRDLPVSDEPVPASAPRPATPPVDAGRDGRAAGTGSGGAPPHGTPGGPPTGPVGPVPEEPIEPIDLASGEPTQPISPAAGPVPPAPQRRTAPVAPGSEEPTEPLASLSADRSGEAVRPAPEPAVFPPAATPPADPVFLPANEVEEELLDAAGTGSTDTFLSTLLLARVLLPVAPDSAPGSRPGEPGFVWRTEELDGERHVVVHTSPERLADHADAAVETVEVRFVQLIRRWPDEQWSFAVNPGTPVGAKLPGEQIVALANWATEMGLGDDVEPEASTEPAPAVTPRYVPTANDPTKPVVMQKAIAPSQLAYYLERGYDRVSGFVHRANELAHLTTPAQLHDALGLGYPDSPFARGAETIYVLRWPAYRPSLYRIPYGGQNEAAMRAMEGWVMERAPFRGNGFAPGESSDVVAEFKVDSARLPHGAQLWRIGADGTERVIATLDTDTLLWRQVGES